MERHGVTATLYPSIGEAIVTARASAKGCDDDVDPFGYDSPLRRPTRPEPYLDLRTHLTHDDNLARSQRRRTSNIRRSAKHLSADRILTPTTRPSDNIYAPSELWQQWKQTRWTLTRWGVHVPDWVAVPERHDSERTSDAKRGSLHLHVLLGEYIDVEAVTRAWSLGAVNIAKRELTANADSPFTNSERLAFYLAAYVGGGSRSKESARATLAEEHPHARLWSRSRGAKPPEHRFTAATPDDALELVVGSLGHCDITEIPPDDFRPRMWAVRTRRTP